MNYKDPENDSRKYIDGVYTSKNGYNNSGLNCPKGRRLYDPSLKSAIFFNPDDLEIGEVFEILTNKEAPGILPYYAISNYGRVLNIRSGQILKQNFRGNGYGYYVLSSDNCKYGQKKFNTHRLVMKKFKPVENMDSLTVNHIDADKSHNYVDKVMEDGSIVSNLEWSTLQDNIIHAEKNNLRIRNKLSYQEAENIRKLHNEGYSYKYILDNFYPYVSFSTIQNICTNRTYITRG